MMKMHGKWGILNGLSRSSHLKKEYDFIEQLRKRRSGKLETSIQNIDFYHFFDNKKVSRKAQFLRDLFVLISKEGEEREKNSFMCRIVNSNLGACQSVEGKRISSSWCSGLNFGFDASFDLGFGISIGYKWFLTWSWYWLWRWHCHWCHLWLRERWASRRRLSGSGLWGYMRMWKGLCLFRSSNQESNANYHNT